MKEARRGEDGEGEQGGTSCPAPPAQAWADFGHTSAERAAVLSWTGARTASAGWVRPLAGLVKFGDLLIVLDGSFGSGRRGALGPVPHQLVPEQPDDADRMGASDGDKRSFRGNKALGDQTVEMRMKARGIVTVALQGGDHAGEGAAVGGGLLEEFLDRGIKAPAQQAEEPAVVLEAEAQHFGDGHDVLADREVSQNLLVDALGKEQGAFLMA